MLKKINMNDASHPRIPDRRSSGAVGGTELAAYARRTRSAHEPRCARVSCCSGSRRRRRRELREGRSAGTAGRKCYKDRIFTATPDETNDDHPRHRVEDALKLHEGRAAPG